MNNDNLKYLFFKAFVPDSTAHYYTNSADKVWIHDSGNVAVLADGVSGSSDPVKSADYIVEILKNFSYEENNTEKIDFLNTSLNEIILKLNKHLIDKAKYENLKLYAVVVIIRKIENVVEFAWVGNPRLYQINPNSYKDDQIKNVIPIESQPIEVIGFNESISPNSQVINLEQNSDSFFILSTDGIDYEKLKKIDVKILNSKKTEKDWKDLGRDIASEKDWAFIVFPYENRLGYIKQEWPYNPFVGKQEEYEHEKKGLSDIADVLFKDKNFDGFKIVGSNPMINKNGKIRRFDGILISPLGIYLLELKNYTGKITMDMDKYLEFSEYMDNNGELHKNKGNNKAKNIIEIINIFADNIKKTAGKICLNNVANNFIKNGLFIFTNSDLNVECIIDQVSRPIPIKYGEVIITKIIDIPEMLKKNFNDSKIKDKNKLTKEEINLLSETLNNAIFEEKTVNNETDFKTIGRFKFDLMSGEDIYQYLKIYKGHYVENKNKKILVKEYKLTTMAKGNEEEERKRLERELSALQDLRHVDGLQNYIDKFYEESYFYVILEDIGGITLVDWLQTKPERIQKIAVLKKLSQILLELHRENIIHRAITPQNIIIKEAGAKGEILPYLTNFELCHLEYLPTIAPENRRSIDIKFQAREVNAPGDIVTTSADVYSFGKIVCYILSEDNSIPFDSYIDLNKFLKKKNAWPDYIKKMGLDESRLDNIKRMLSMDPAERPVGEELVDLVSKIK